MATELLHHALNVGVVDKNKLFRVDLERMRLAAEEQTNIFCDAVGRGFLRPGTEHLGAALAKARILPFIAGGSDAFILEMTDEKMRVWNADTLELVTRTAVDTTITSGDFSSDSGWTLSSAAGQSTVIGELEISPTVGTVFGNMTVAGGNDAAFDGTTSQAISAAARANSVTSAYVGKRFTGGKSISSVSVVGASDQGYVVSANPATVIELYGKTGSTEPANATDGTLLGTTGSFADTADTSNDPRVITSSDTDTEFTFVWIRVRRNDNASATFGVAEVTFSAGLSQLVMSARAHGATAEAKQQVVVAGGDQGVEHALRIVVSRGPVTLRLGATEGGSEYLPNEQETVLFTGTHSIAFTPVGDFWLQLSSDRQTQVQVDSCAIEAAGVLELPTYWTEALLPKIRVTQSLDVMFVACEGVKQQRIERRGDTSWSVVDYDAEDGPFLIGRTSNVKLTPAATEGTTTLTASKPFFTPLHAGALFKIFHEGQKIETYLAGEGEFTPTWLVTGITETNHEEREWSVTIAGTWVGTLQHERSFDGEDVEFHAFRRETSSGMIDITANATFTNDDNEDNAITYYRMKMREYTSGEAQISIDYPGGGGYGICRVITVNSPTDAEIEILTPFLGTSASEDWQEGAWSPARGYPTNVAMHEGRLCWAGFDRFWASVSDAYNSFDEDFIGDAGPLIRSIALGGRNEARWMLTLSSLLIGCDTRVANIRTSSLDEILTPENFGIKSLSKVGAAALSPVELADDRALFVHDSGSAIYEVNWSAERSRYLVTPFSKLTTDLLAAGVTSMDVQVIPDQRIWIATADADAVMVVFEPSQEVVAHIPISTSSDTDFIESLAVVPGTEQDRVWMSVKRVVDGQTVRYIERLAKDSEARPATITKCVDSHVVFGAGSATITGLDHLEGRTVVAWMDGDAVNVDDSLGVQQVAKEFVVSGGEITLPSTPVTGGCVGLPYRGRFKMARLAYSLGSGTSMLKNKAPAKVGFILSDLCRSGLKFGTRFDDAEKPLRSLSELVKGAAIEEVIIGMQPDEDMHSLGGEIGLDPRVCFEMNSPKPCTVNSLVLGLENYE